SLELADGVRLLQLLLDALDAALRRLALATQQGKERPPLVLDATLLARARITRCDRREQRGLVDGRETVLARRRRAARRIEGGLLQCELAARLPQRPQRLQQASARIEQVEIAAATEEREHELEAPLLRAEAERELAIPTAQRRRLEPRAREMGAQVGTEAGQRLGRGRHARELPDVR